MALYAASKRSCARTRSCARRSCLRSRASALRATVHSAWSAARRWLKKSVTIAPKSGSASCAPSSSGVGGSARSSPSPSINLPRSSRSW
eukprot:6052176-Prymnesium_polylepis.1